MVLVLLPKIVFADPDCENLDAQPEYVAEMCAMYKAEEEIEDLSLRVFVHLVEVGSESCDAFDFSNAIAKYRFRYVDMMSAKCEMQMLCSDGGCGNGHPGAMESCIRDGASSFLENVKQDLKDSWACDSSGVDEFSSVEKAKKVGPSFECGKASTDVEKVICSNKRVSAYDLILSSVFKRMQENKEVAESERRFQLKWLKERNQCVEFSAGDAGRCLEVRYIERINMIREALLKRGGI